MNQQDRQGNIVVHSHNNFPVEMQQCLPCVFLSYIQGGCAQAILIPVTVVAAIYDAGDLSCEAAHYTDSLLALIHYIMDCKDISLVWALLVGMWSVKEKKKFWVHPITSQRLLKGKFYSLYEDLKALPHKFFLDISECLVQHLINCWFCLVKVLHFKIPE